MYSFARKYPCPFRTKHRVKNNVIKNYCTITHEECKYRPRKCPILRAQLNKNLLEMIK